MFLIKLILFILKKKTATNYITWLKTKNIFTLNKVGVSKYLMNVIKNPGEQAEALERTLSNYEKLVELINKKLEQN